MRFFVESPPCFSKRMRILASSLRRSIPYFFLKLLLASIILKLSMLVICGNPVIKRNICDRPKTTNVSAITPKDAAKQQAAISQQQEDSSNQPAADAKSVVEG